MLQTKKLKIIHTESSCGWGGQEIRILTESQGMLERGHSIHLLCPQESNLYKDALKRGLSVSALPIARKKLSAVFALRQWLKQNPVDLINTHSSTDSWLVALATRLMRNPPKIVRTRHVSAPVSQNSATRWLYTSASDFIVTTGEKLRQVLISVNQFPAEKIRSVPTGIDEKYFQPGDSLRNRNELGLPEDKFIVGIVATIRSWKGHVYLIESLSTLQDPNVHLLIVGDGPSRSIVEDKLSESGLTANCSMVGQQADVVPWLQSMDLFVLPSYANEGVPQSIMQAMLCGLAVISTPVGSIAEAVLDGETGVLVEEKNAIELSDAIKRLVTSKELRSRYAAAGRKYALEHFTAEQMVDKMENIFLQSLR